MTNYKLAYIEHITQLLISRLRKAHHLMGDAQRELEGIQSTLKALSTTYGGWLVEKEFDVD